MLMILFSGLEFQRDLINQATLLFLGVKIQQLLCMITTKALTE